MGKEPGSGAGAGEADGVGTPEVAGDLAVACGDSARNEVGGGPADDGAAKDWPKRLSNAFCWSCEDSGDRARSLELPVVVRRKKGLVLWLAVEAAGLVTSAALLTGVADSSVY